jgi:hypothetical protein
MRTINIFILMTVMLLCSLPVSAATVAYWNFEDGVAGQLFCDAGEEGSTTPEGTTGSYDAVNGYLMRGWNNYYGPSFSDDTPFGWGLSMHCLDNHQDGYVQDEAMITWSPTQWTIEVSFKFDSLTGWNSLIGRQGASFGQVESDFYFQRIGVAPNNLRCDFYTAGGVKHVLDGDFIPGTGQWYRAAVVSDGVTVTMYVDQMDGQGYQNVGSLELTGTGEDNALPASGFDWTFGRAWYNGGNVDNINGYMDNVKFSDVALPVVMLGFEPYAYDRSVTPVNSDGSVGNLVVNGSILTAEDIMLGFKAGPDPNAGETGNAMNPRILAHHIYLSSDTNPDPVFLATVPQTSTTDPNISYGPLTLEVGTAYNWKVEEALDNGLGSPRNPGDPNNIMGPQWSFTTIAPTPYFVTQPANVVADLSGNAVISVVGSASAQYYKWYKVGDPDELTDEAPYSGTSTANLTITGATLAEEGQYYAVAYFGITPSDPSTPARLWLSRLMGYWKFDGDMLDSVGDEETGAQTHDGAIAGDGPGDENYVGDGNGMAGNAMAFQDDGDFVAISGGVDPNNAFNFFPQGFTTSLWYQADVNDLVGWRLPISKLDAGSAGWLFGTDHLFPAPQYTFIVESPNNRMDGGTLPNVGDGQWHMLTVTYDPAATLLRLFTDGDEDTQLTVDLSAAPLPFAPLSIGGRNTENSISGAIDEVRIYSYPLTPTQVAQMYTGFRPAEYVCVSPDDGAFDQVDLDGNCKVNLADIAIAAHQWLECQRIPTAACDW